ncbi:MAG: hypothetical protein M1826_005365 [Phylliscum demangeonii]|nr:MAG: hypothetical protein M1826_005365 [Phylliscum demangeonii]
MCADIPDQRKSWPSHLLKPRAQKPVMLVKRTSNEESGNRQEDVHREIARKGPIVYTPEEMAGFRDHFNAARRAYSKLRYKLRRAKIAGLKVSENDVQELSRLKKVTSQNQVVLARARLGKPLDRPTKVTKKDIASLEQDPKIQQAAKLGVYNARQLAEYKRSYIDAETRFHSRKRQLTRVAEVRKITETEEEELADLKRALNLQKTMWERASKGRPADQQVFPLKKSMEDLIGSPKLQQVAQSSGYSVEELAVAKRRWLDSNNAVNAFKRELTKVQKVRQVTPEEDRRLQTLLKAANQHNRMFDRMSRGKPADYRKGFTAFLEDPDNERMARLGGYTVEEVAQQKREFLDAKYEYRAAYKLLSVIKNEDRTLLPEEEDYFVKTDRAYHLQKTAWEHMSKGERVDPRAQPLLQFGKLGKAVAALQQDAKVDEIAQAPDPVDRVVHKRQDPKNTQAPEIRRTGNQEQADSASRGGPAKKEEPSTPPPHQPLQMSDTRNLRVPVLAPYLSSASHFLQGLGRQWHALPWTRYLVKPRLKMAKPAELLRADHALL